jgi:multidrug efflux pump subunit AcrA (membrane-fusion protein)
MSCVVRVHNLEQTPQIVIPSRAIIEQMGEYFVYIAKDTVIHRGGDSAAVRSDPPADSVNGPHLTAIQVKVETGETIGSNTIIKSGLNDGDRLVVDGIQSLHDGSRITTENKQGPGSGGRGGR